MNTLAHPLLEAKLAGSCSVEKAEKSGYHPLFPEIDTYSGQYVQEEREITRG